MQPTTGWPAWRGSSPQSLSPGEPPSTWPAWRGSSPSTQSLSPGEPPSTWPAWRGSSPSTQSLSPGRRVFAPTQPAPFSRPGVLPGAPTCTEPARPWKKKMMQSCRGGEKSRQGGARGRGGEGQSCPGGATLLKQFCRFLLLDRAFHSYFFGQILNLDLGKPHSLSVRFAENLSSQSQHVTRARGSKHVMQRNEERKINIEFKKSVFA